MITEFSEHTQPTPDSVPAPWFAVLTKWQSERLVQQALERKGYECFLPVSNDAVAETGPVLIPGCVFCRLDGRSRLSVLKVPGVVRISGDSGVPAPVDQRIIVALQSIVAAGIGAEPWLQGVAVGPRVRISHGSARGVEGIYVQRKGQGRLVFSIPVLERAIAVQIDQECVQPAA